MFFCGGSEAGADGEGEVVVGRHEGVLRVEDEADVGVVDDVGEEGAVVVDEAGAEIAAGRHHFGEVALAGVERAAVAHRWEQREVEDPVVGHDGVVAIAAKQLEVVKVEAAEQREALRGGGEHVVGQTGEVYFGSAAGIGGAEHPRAGAAFLIFREGVDGGLGIFAVVEIVVGAHGEQAGIDVVEGHANAPPVVVAAEAFDVGVALCVLALEFGREAGAVEGEVEGGAGGVVVARELVYVPVIADADGHEAQVDAHVVVEVRAYDDHALLLAVFLVEGVEEVAVALGPGRGVCGDFPVLAGADNVVGVVGVEGLVAPVIDLAAEVCEAWIVNARVVDSESGLGELLQPVAAEGGERIGGLVGGHRRQGGCKSNQKRQKEFEILHCRLMIRRAFSRKRGSSCSMW